MRIRSFLAFVISICITFAFVPVKTFAFSERGNAQFTDVVNTNNLEHYINKTSKIDLANKLISQIISLKK